MTAALFLVLVVIDRDNLYLSANVLEGDLSGMIYCLKWWVFGKEEIQIWFQILFQKWDDYNTSVMPKISYLVRPMDCEKSIFTEKTKACWGFSFYHAKWINYRCVAKFSYSHHGHRCHGNYRYVGFHDFHELFFFQGWMTVQHTSIMTLKKQELGAQGSTISFKLARPRPIKFF